MIALALMLMQAANPNPYARYAHPYAGPSGQFGVAGIGTRSCATALRPEYSVDLFGWILGFWTGMNAVREANVGASTDAAGIVAEVKRTCEEHPSELLVSAALKTYVEMAKR